MAAQRYSAYRFMSRPTGTARAALSPPADNVADAGRQTGDREHEERKAGFAKMRREARLFRHPVSSLRGNPSARGRCNGSASGARRARELQKVQRAPPLSILHAQRGNVRTGARHESCQSSPKPNTLMPTCMFRTSATNHGTVT